jgi:hypothetical protein
MKIPHSSPWLPVTHGYDAFHVVENDRELLTPLAHGKPATERTEREITARLMQAPERCSRLTYN